MNGIPEALLRRAGTVLCMLFVATEAVAAEPVLIRTHVDLAVAVSLDAVIVKSADRRATDWRIKSAVHGTAQLSSNERQLVFTPEPGYSGPASIALQRSTRPEETIEVDVHVSDARLRAIHLAPPGSLSSGKWAKVKVTLDFDDQQAVALTDGRYLNLSSVDLRFIGADRKSVLRVDDELDRIQAIAGGPAVLVASRSDSSGNAVRGILAINVPALQKKRAELAEEDQGETEAQEDIPVRPIVYPGNLALPPGVEQRLSVGLTDRDRSERDVTSPIQRDSVQPQIVVGGTTYFSSDEHVASVNTLGLVTAKSPGLATISVVHLAAGRWGGTRTIGQTSIAVRVEKLRTVDRDPLAPTPATVRIVAKDGGGVASRTGETVLIAPDHLKEDAPVGIRRLDVSQLFRDTGAEAPLPGILEVLGGFHLDIGEQVAAVPFQMIVPGQRTGLIDRETEVLFLRRGTMRNLDGLEQPAWWVVDHGYASTDGVIRTGSVSAFGVNGSGDYIVVAPASNIHRVGDISIPGWSPGSVAVATGGLVWGMPENAGAFTPGESMPDIVASVFMAAPSQWYSLAWTSPGLYVVRKAGRPARMDERVLKIDDLERPRRTEEEGLQIVGIDRVNERIARIKLKEPPKNGAPSDAMMIRSWLGTGYIEIFQDPISGAVMTRESGDEYGYAKAHSIGWIVSRQLADAKINRDGVSVDLEIPDGIVLGFHGLKLQCMVKGTGPAGNVMWSLFGEPADLRHMEPPALFGGLLSLGERALVLNYDANGKFALQPSSIKTAVLKDSQGRQKAISARAKIDLADYPLGGSLAYLASDNGEIHVFDMILERFARSFKLPGQSSDIAGLVSVGARQLYVSESGPNGRLLRVDIDPKSPNFLQTRQIVLPKSRTGFMSAPNGYGPVGTTFGVHTYLAVTVPPAAQGEQSGKVFILDTDELEDVPGRPDQLRLPESALGIVSFSAGQRLAPTFVLPVNVHEDHLQLLVTLDGDQGGGLMSVRAKLEKDFRPGREAPARTIPFGDGSKNAPADPVGIRRSWSPVVVWGDKYDALGNVVLDRDKRPVAVQYAIVADNPNDGQSDGFSGAKLGIVRDPFGSKPEYLGSTTPMPGTRFNFLDSDARKVLVALAWRPGHGPGESGVNEMIFWDVPSLIRAAEINSIRKQHSAHPKPIDHPQFSAKEGHAPRVEMQRFEIKPAGDWPTLPVIGNGLR